MTVPMEYRLASQRFENFLADVAEEAGLATRNHAYTVAEGVMHAFRRRLPVEDAIAFAQVLPAMLRALFVANWKPAAPAGNWDRELMLREVKALRRHHNFAPDSSLRDVVVAVRRHVEIREFEACIARLSPEAGKFWMVDADNA